MSKIDNALEHLIECILESEEYSEYDARRNQIKKYPVLKARADEFRERNFRLQMSNENAFDKMDQLEKEYADVGIYNPGRNEYSREDMGAFPGLVLARPDRVRGGNHLNSFAAVGPLARELAACQTNEDVYAPLKKLYELDGLVLLMGTGLDTATAIHYAEEKAERYPFVRWSKDGSGKTIPVRTGGCSEGFPKLDAVLSPYEQQAQVEKSLWRSYRIRDLVDTAEKAFRENPLVTHCGDPDCARCNDAIKGGPR